MSQQSAKAVTSGLLVGLLAHADEGRDGAIMQGRRHGAGTMGGAADGAEALGGGAGRMIADFVREREAGLEGATGC